MGASPEWQVVPDLTDVPCDLQPTARQRLLQQPYGRTPGQTRDFFFASGLDIRTEDGISVTIRTDMGTEQIPLSFGGYVTGRRIDPPWNFVVRSPADYGAPGDLEIETEAHTGSFE